MHRRRQHRLDARATWPAAADLLGNGAQEPCGRGQRSGQRHNSIGVAVHPAHVADRTRVIAGRPFSALPRYHSATAAAYR